MSLRVRSFLGALAAIMIVSASAIAAGNKLEFRPVLSRDELNGKKYNIVQNGNSPIYVWQLSYLSDCDIQNVEMFRSANTSKYLLLGVALNDESRKRLYRFCSRFGKRRLAVFAEGKFIGIVPAEPPVFLGDKIIVRWPGTEAELRSFVLKVNKKPQSIVSLYIEEQGKYNDIAADAWAETYGNMNRYVETKRRQFSSEKALVEEARDQE